MPNLLTDTEGRLTFTQYTVSDFWTSGSDENGFPVLEASVQTIEDVPYELEFNLAANLSAGVQSVTVEVIYGGEQVGSFVHDGAIFQSYSFTFDGTGNEELLQFRVMGGSSQSSTVIDTGGVVPSYEKTMTFSGQEVTVNAFAPGQSAVYQVLNGQLVKFDLATNSYQTTEVSAVVNLNAVGYSAQDDLIYGLARSNGSDATGNALTSGDVVAIDARGSVHKVADGTYGSYIGDMDENGQLWVFPANLNQAVIYDVSAVAEDGTIPTTYLTLPGIDGSTRGFADLAYNPTDQTFYGVAYGRADGDPGRLIAVDVSQVALGGEAVVTSSVISGTIVEGETRDGIPRSAYGATMVDADGNVYVGANSANHDLDSSTPASGGFYRLVTQDDGNLYMELLADSPRVSSNDGAMDVRGVDPFLGVDSSSTVLLREPILSIALAEDDMIRTAAKGSDVTYDLLANDSASEGDSLNLTMINGQAAAQGMVLALENGGSARYEGDGIVTVTPGTVTQDISSAFTYTVQTQALVTDTATVTVVTSPVDGTAGNDQMLTTFVDQAGEEVDGSDGPSDVILGYGGNDKIFAGAGDDDVYGGPDHDFMRGGSGADLIDGSDGNDVVDGGDGGDTMHGGAGDDVYYIDHIGDVIGGETGGHDLVKTELDHILGDVYEDLWLIDETAALLGEGNALDNDIKGNSLGNTLRGHSGDDSIEGYGGDDTVYGGSGHDRILGDAGSDVLFGDQGNDKLHGNRGSDLLTGGEGNDTLDAGEGADTLYGGEGNDLMSGGADADVMEGGAGNDSYIVQDAGDIVVEAEQEGTDSIKASVSFTLPDYVETLRMTGGAILGTGNNQDNSIFGNGLSNVLTGFDGRDRLVGGAGDDVLRGGSGRDDLTGGVGDDTLNGGADADKLDGGAGNNSLRGGEGDDRMKAGADIDTFVFTSGDGRDTVYKFDADEDLLVFESIQEGSLSYSDQRKGIQVAYGDGDTIYLVGIYADQISDLDISFL